MSGGDEAPGVARSGAGALALGAAACAACCAGPILGALGAIGVASVVGYALVGALALVVGVAVGAMVVVHRRRRRRACAVLTSTVAMVEAPAIRGPRGDAGGPGPAARQADRSAPA